MSFTEEEEFEREASRRRADDEDIETFWTVYGIDAEGRSYAVSDYTEKASTFEMLYAILAPMAQARDLIDNGDAEEASRVLTDFINQCSNAERI